MSSTSRAIYSFKVLCFGLCHSPYKFYKCHRPVVSYLRSLDKNCIICGRLLSLRQKSTIRDHTDTVIHTLEDLGLHVNFEKSVLEPTQRITYLGYTVTTEGEYPSISATRERVCTIKRLIKNLLNKKSCSARMLARCAGLCVSTAWVVSPGKLYLRHIYHLLALRNS